MRRSTVLSLPLQLEFPAENTALPEEEGGLSLVLSGDLEDEDVVLLWPVPFLQSSTHKRIITHATDQ